MAEILLVEDEPSIADAVKFVLGQDGHQVMVAGTLCVARGLWQRVDLVVLDIGLPDGNGMDFCKELRRQSLVPVIFLSARTEEIDRILGLELGGDDYLSKPFSPRELAVRVKTILRRTQKPAAAPSSPLCLGPLFVDLDRASAVVGSEPVDLTRQELLLLHFLMQNPGRVYSRGQLMEAVWECPDSALERTVDAHIKTLRAKLKSAGCEQEMIQTHRGFGYSLSDSL